MCLKYIIRFVYYCQQTPHTRNIEKHTIKIESLWDDRIPTMLSNVAFTYINM